VKYVMFKVPSPTGGPPVMVPVLFPSTIMHSDVAEAIRLCRGMEHAEIESAGTVFLNGPAATIGGSDTLKLEARPDDAAVILNQI
jgi:hypothetical protein